MNHFLRAVLLSALILSGGDLSAQESSFQLGIRLGGGMSVNPGMDKILVSEDYYSNYTFKDKWQAALKFVGVTWSVTR